MNTLNNKEILISSVTCTENFLIVKLNDGREISVPISWFPLLKNATSEQRNKCRLIADGIGVHWTEIDEDVSLESLFDSYDNQLHAIKNSEFILA